MSDGTPTISVLFTDGLPVFRWKADDVRWSLVDSIGQPSYMKSYKKQPEVKTKTNAYMRKYIYKSNTEHDLNESDNSKQY